MMTVTDSIRLPLTPRRAVSTFAMSMLGLLTANLLPLMLIALEQSLGMTITQAGGVLTGSLLATAIACTAATRLAEGAGRVRVAQVGLVISAVAFSIAAISPGVVATVTAVIVGGAGVGGALAASGAALAALKNPNRTSAVNGLVNRAVVTAVLALIPLIGITTGSAFGCVAAISVILLFTAQWLPRAPLATTPTLASATVAEPQSRAVTIAGIALLAMFALWAISEDSVWALAGTMGADQTGLTDAGLGVVLSISSAGGFVAALALMVVGDTLGRAVPLAVLLVAGGALKLTASLTSDPTAYTIVLIAWNTVYLAAFLLFIATAAALDANGRFSGPSIGVYLFGSSFSPLVGAWLAESFGYSGFGWAIAITSWVLIVPVVIIAALSTRIERRDRQREAASENEREVVR
ncbi:MFS transporter [Rathayibacter tritici]|uniref:MFS transporter n=1 Tax=Rathayibacter tritici TaxID=33888 RepID=UPI001B8095E6|nr:MFS transporter [Rathayibacter tritici]